MTISSYKCLRLLFDLWFSVVLAAVSINVITLIVFINPCVLLFERVYITRISISDTRVYLPVISIHR